MESVTLPVWLFAVLLALALWALLERVCEEIERDGSTGSTPDSRPPCARPSITSGDVS